MATQWKVEIDWERNGNYTGTYDNVTDRTILTQWFVGMRQPYQLTADNSVLRLVLRNDDRLFSAEYASSPLKDKLVPLRPVRIQSDDGTDTRTHFTGWVETIIPSVNQLWRAHRHCGGYRRYAVSENDRDQDRAAREPAQRRHHRHA